MTRRTKLVSCSRCGETWPRDPRIEVACPDCRAPIGSPCKRPSEHVAMQVHIAREQLAVDLGFLSKTCPATRGAERVV